MTNLTYEEFVQELKSEIKYHSNNGTNYRKTTATLSPKIAKKTEEIDLFFNHNKTLDFVHKHLKTNDMERKQDVARMLVMIARHLNMKHELKRNNNLQMHVNQML